MKFTSVVSLHLNPLTCGVARFNQELAKRLSVPMVSYYDDWGAFPLVSLKWREVIGVDEWHYDEPQFDEWREKIRGLDYGVFWHDTGDPFITRGAAHVFYGDPSLGQNGLWCPPVIADLPKPAPSHLKILTACMAHKLDAEPYERLRELLDTTPHTAQLRVSVAIHEGTTLNDAELHFNALKAVMGRHHVYVMGCLTDEALARELRKALAVAAFYPKGVRANNTTAHAAMSQGRALITNLDKDSPKDFIHNDTCFDIYQMTAWPSIPQIDRVAKNGRELYDSTYDWVHLVSRIEALCASSK
jgi:hypothetical protein